MGIAGGKKREKGGRGRGGIVPDPFVHEPQKGQKERLGGPENLVEEDQGSLGDSDGGKGRGGERGPVALHVEETLVVGEIRKSLRGQSDDKTFSRSRRAHQVEVLPREKGQHHRPDHLLPLLEHPVQISLEPSELRHDRPGFLARFHGFAHGRFHRHFSPAPSRTGKDSMIMMENRVPRESL